MPKISLRGSHMPPSPIRKLVPYADVAKKKGIHVYHLNIGQPDIETPKEALNAVYHSDIKVLEYSPSQGFDTYRAALSEYYKKKNIQVEKTDILITTGGSEAISFAIQACLNPGEEIIIPEPFYANYNGFSTACGVNIIPIPSSIEDNFRLPSIDAFEKAITPRTKAIMICNPNNPTGYLYSEEELNQLKDICLKHDLFLFSDEAYREFCYDGKIHKSAMSIEGLENHTILLDTISKRYSACGARIGALVTRNQEVYSAVLKMAQARLSPPTFEQILGEAACQLPDSYFEPILNEYTLRRDTLIEGLKSIPGVTCPNPGGAFYVMAQLPIDDCDHFCQWILESFHHNGHTIMLAPGTGFYATAGLGKKEVRLAYVLNVESIRGAIECLREALNQYPGKTI